MIRILWLKTELLHPLDKGGRIRTYNMLRELKRHFYITYLTLDDGRASPVAVALADEYCNELERIPFHTTSKDSPRLYFELFQNLFSLLPYAVAKYKSTAMRQRITECLASGRYDVVVCDFLHPSINMPKTIGCPAVLFQHNVEAKIWFRHKDVSSMPLRRLYFHEQWRRMEIFERRECQRYDHVIAVSKTDAEQLQSKYELSSVSYVPTGVDTAYFEPSKTTVINQYEMLFAGSMDWLPNEDAIVYFAEEILPLVRRSVPEAYLSVVGRNPTNRLRLMARKETGIRLVGSVPDIRPYMQQAALFVVPIRIGGGTRLKIFEAMAMGKPVVSTSVGAEGLPVVHGEHLRIADSPKAFAGEIVELINWPERATLIGSIGARYVCSQFGWDSVTDTFKKILEEVAINRNKNRVRQYK